MENLDDIVSLMKKLAFDAELIVKENENYRVSNKGKFDIVTDVDMLIEQHCIDVLKQEYPHIPIVGEETLSRTVSENDAFFLDPLDGTKNFAYGLPTWGFQIAYVVNKSEPVASVIFLPELGILVESQKDRGTKINGETPATPYSNEIENSLWLLEGKPEKWAMGRILSPQVLGARSYGSASVTFAMTLLKGACAILYNIKTLWDVYAGICACKNAGKICKTLDDGTIIVCQTQQQLDFALKIIDEAKQLDWRH